MKRQLAQHGREFTVESMRFPDALKHDPAIDTWLRGVRDDLRPLAETWFAKMRACGEDVCELMHDGCPVACVEDVAFGYVNAFKAHVNVGFFHGALLDDPTRLLIETGKRMRHVKLRPGCDLDVTWSSQRSVMSLTQRMRMPKFACGRDARYNIILIISVTRHKWRVI